MPNFDPLTVSAGLVVAPAGCGKTQLISDSLAHRDNPSKPVLVLTHTNAGVVALRKRLALKQVKASAARVATIDGWCMQLLHTFPSRSSCPSGLLDLTNPGRDYPRIREYATTLVREGHLDTCLRASYSNVFVDEYQDCTQKQHELISAMAERLPTCVFGDPLQAIFDFGADTLPMWEEVVRRFPVVATLDKPWRWINANNEPLGDWILECRATLLAGEAIDLREVPPTVSWVELDHPDDYETQRAAASTPLVSNETGALVICFATAPRNQRKIASQTPGAISVESVSLDDLVALAGAFTLDANGLSRIVDFAKQVMTGVDSRYEDRIDSLRSGRARTPASDSEAAGIAFLERPTFGRAADVLVAMNRQPGSRNYRPEILNAALRALADCAEGVPDSFLVAAVRAREQNRAVGRRLPKRAVGSTLLLKGLEADVAIVLDADRLNAQGLYVALSRGCKRLIVCSSRARLP